MSSQDITDRQQAEQALRLTQYTIDHCSTAIYWLHADGRIFYTNEAARQQLGYSQEEMLGLSIPDIDPDWPADYWPTGWQRVKQAGVLTFESHHRRKDGRIFPVDVTTNFIERGGEEYVFAFVIDITERKRAEEALRLTQYAIDHCSTAIAWIRPNGRVFYANEAECQQLGYSREELQNMSVFDIDPDWPADDWPEGWQKLKQAGVVTFEARHRHKDGHIFPVEVTTNYMEWGGEEYLFAFNTDITERKRAEATLRLTQYTVDHCSTAITWIRPNGRIFYTNEAARQQLGYSRDELHSMSVFDVDPDWPVGSWPAGWQKLKEAGVVTFESRHRRKDGHIFPVEITTNYMERGGEEYLFAFVTDITERKRAEQELRDSETRLHAIFDHHYQLTGLMDCEGRLLAANKTALDFAGAAESEVIGQYFWDTPWWHPSQEAALRQKIQHAAQGEFVRFECTHIRADGEVRDFDFSLSPVRDDGGNVVYLVPEGRDITDMKWTEEQLREQEARLAHVARLSTMGEMAAGVAHEVGQPLNAIVNYARASQNVLEAEGEPSVSDLREWNAAIARSAKRASDVVRRMRTFARRGESDRSICDINEIVRESIQMVAFDARRCRAAVHLELPETSPRVDAGRVQIQQVLVNLLRNAFEAMGESESTARDVTVRVEPDGQSIRVSVADTGPGLPAREDLDIFDPFVTHKEDGLGLGLAISSSIIKAHRGELRAESAAGGGAEFHFTIPAIKASGR